MDIIRELENEQLKSEVTPFNVGDTIRVYAKVVEGTRERLQMFEGVVIKRQGGGIRETFTVRRIASGVGVERTWPVHSPRIDRIVHFVPEREKAVSMNKFHRDFFRERQKGFCL